MYANMYSVPFPLQPCPMESFIYEYMSIHAMQRYTRISPSPYLSLYVCVRTCVHSYCCCYWSRAPHPLRWVLRCSSCCCTGGACASEWRGEETCPRHTATCRRSLRITTKDAEEEAEEEQGDCCTITTPTPARRKIRRRLFLLLHPRLLRLEERQEEEEEAGSLMNLHHTSKHGRRR